MTTLLYLLDSYKTHGTGQIIDMGKDELGEYILLDQTLFYPQGGGQPSDIGEIYSGKNLFHVTKCRLNQDGVVYHYGTLSSGELRIGEQVSLNIESENRVRNARNHSAGHLLDVAMSELGYSSHLTPTKGYHFQNGAYVEYEGSFEESSESFIPKIEQKMADLIEQKIPIFVTYKNLEDMHAPKGKTPRQVYFQGYEGCGCGGTHVKNSQEILGVTIRKIKYKKGVLRVSYECQ